MRYFCESIAVSSACLTACAPPLNTRQSVQNCQRHVCAMPAGSAGTLMGRLGDKCCRTDVARRLESVIGSWTVNFAFKHLPGGSGGPGGEPQSSAWQCFLILSSGSPSRAAGPHTAAFAAAAHRSGLFSNRHGHHSPGTTLPRTKSTTTPGSVCRWTHKAFKLIPYTWAPAQLGRKPWDF